MEKEFKFEIINELGHISEEDSSWKKELNRISWSGDEPKYDIRQWNEDHSKVGNGISLNEKEMKNLVKLLNKEIEFLDND